MVTMLVHFPTPERSPLPQRQRAGKQSTSLEAQQVNGSDPHFSKFLDASYWVCASGSERSGDPFVLGKSMLWEPE